MSLYSLASGFWNSDICSWKWENEKIRQGEHGKMRKWDNEKILSKRARSLKSNGAREQASPKSLSAKEPEREREREYKREKRKRV